MVTPLPSRRPSFPTEPSLAQLSRLDRAAQQSNDPALQDYSLRLKVWVYDGSLDAVTLTFLVDEIIHAYHLTEPSEL